MRGVFVPSAAVALTLAVSPAWGENGTDAEPAPDAVAAEQHADADGTPAQLTNPIDVPLLPDIVIDGYANDWADRGFRHGRLRPAHGDERPADDFSADFRLGWNRLGLVVMVEVTDDLAVESLHRITLYENDSVELYVADRRGGREMVKVTLAPGRTERHTDLRLRAWDYREDAELRRQPIRPIAARSLTPDGYVMEVLVPWREFGVDAQIGREVGFQIHINDSDDEDTCFKTVWHPGKDTFEDSTQMYALRLISMAHLFAAAPADAAPQREQPAA